MIVSDYDSIKFFLSGQKTKIMQKTSIIILFFLGITHSLLSQVIPFNSERWKIEAKSYVLENIDGQDAIYLQNGSAVLNDVDFLNGTIEFDMRITERRSYSGVLFRIIDDYDYEHFYIRPHLNNKPDACQYTPVYNGLSGWQMYFGESYSAPISFPFEKWVHMKLEIMNNRADIYYNDMQNPLLSVELKRDAKAGKVGVQSGGAPMHFANFKVTPGSPSIKGKVVPEVPIGENLIGEWSLSSAFDEKSLGTTLSNKELNGLKWQSVKIEPRGIVNIAKYVEPFPEKNTSFARTEIDSDKAKVVGFQVAYSDRGRVYLNGKLLYFGRNEYIMRDYRYLGTIGLFETVYLPLKKGKNDLVIAVSEDFGGWAIGGKLEN